MEINNRFNTMSNTPDLHTAVHSAINSTFQNLNCMRIAIVQEFHPEDLTVTVLIANKKEEKLNFNGSQNVRNFALIRAKVCFCNPFITNPIKEGDECVLLFSDREIESWFINGEVNPIAYPRMHDLTDAVAIFGIRSIPNLITILTDCLHLFYGNTDMQFKENQININATDVNIIGNTTQTGAIKATSLSATSAASGTFTTASSETVTVVNGIITSITSIQ